MIRAHVWAASHTGLVRERNEDSWGVTEMPGAAEDGEIVSVDLAEDWVVAVVADGLGGHPCGDLASRLAVAAVLDAKPRTADELAGAVHRANDALYARMADEPETRGMGTTLAALLVHPGGIAVANVGDSAVFELLDGRPRQLTVDDIPSGPKSLPGVPSGVVTQTLGGSGTFTPVRPHLHLDEVCGDRWFLLCTDGLTNFVPLSDIARLTTVLCDESLPALVSSALEAGGLDNLTILLLRCQIFA